MFFGVQHPPKGFASAHGCGSRATGSTEATHRPPQNARPCSKSTPNSVAPPRSRPAYEPRSPRTEAPRDGAIKVGDALDAVEALVRTHVRLGVPHRVELEVVPGPHGHRRLAEHGRAAPGHRRIPPGEPSRPSRRVIVPTRLTALGDHAMGKHRCRAVPGRVRLVPILPLGIRVRQNPVIAWT